MDVEIKKILGDGLTGGYGASNYSKGERAGFPIDINDHSGPDGKYHDEWAAHQNGGGQELVEIPDGKKWTRVYAGGSLDPESLSKIGLTEDQVSEKIKFFLGAVGKKSRFDVDVELEEGDWGYEYKVTSTIKEIPVFVGQEKIRHKGNLVFIHFIINSPVR